MSGMNGSTTSQSQTGLRSFAQSVRRSVAVSSLFHRRMLWIWPVFAAVLLVLVGWFIRNVVEQALKDNMSGHLQALLNADVTALNDWLESREADADTVASDPEIQSAVVGLVALGSKKETDTAALLQSPHMKQLRETLRPWLEGRGYIGFAVLNDKGRILAAGRDDPIGKGNLPLQSGLMETVFKQSRTTITRPIKSLFPYVTESGEFQVQRPVMYALAPVVDEQGKVIAALGLGIPPERDFTRILSAARAGKSGETYAFDSNGLLLSQSRFDDELSQLGLLPFAENATSILNLQIRDPEANLTEGNQAALPPAKRPLTRMAAAAVEGEQGIDVNGYRDYRGVPVIGAWTWLDKYGMGVTTEQDVAEAYRPLYLLRYAFWTLFGLLAAAAVAIFVFTIFVARLERDARRSALDAQQLGQYSLEEKIGAGGMGVVYRGRHAMLQRPTAIKLLDPDKTTASAVARFEREVRLTSQLNHPNTIAVFDFGRTPEGLFYYAMEYLDGMALDELVAHDGPQPEARVVHILQQVCASLKEAHGIGLIHRDIKPANIMLCQRGGIADFVKVLDFGLVKALDSDQQAALTAADSMTGTPLYLSPEGIEQPDTVDARSDVYALGAVGYFLLTGKPPFEGASVIEICMQHVKTIPVRPSERCSLNISEKLEDILLACLAKKPEERPRSMSELRDALIDCELNGNWTSETADAWWADNGSTITTEKPPQNGNYDSHAQTLIGDSQPHADEA
ncbi:MAG: serine/threonine protein kinase [Planctomycetaceae bacterium]|jgi:eukaryotic-like serine/threonine-protein kinase|nr:serine/threonine protein kinase [Planctomycetaceae bacterium]MBT6485958.1 serine/threonine protein kinase [Planctomycetaceae bacterium]MBT6497884.1 serine/threonine protein kinase [Planctomycetaceae bacterium]